VAKVEGKWKEITEEEMEAALTGKKREKAAEPPGVTGELLQAAGMVGLKE